MSNWSVADHLTNHLGRPKMGDEKHPTLWPSEASAVVTNQWGEQEVLGKCRRATFFRFAIANYNFSKDYAHLKPLVQELQRTEIPVEGYLRWIWQAGSLHEENLVNLAKASGIYITEQTRVYLPGYNMSGLLDFIAINPTNYKYSIVEIKSVYGFGGNVVLGTPYERKKKILATPRDSNLMQIALYDWHYAGPRDEFEHSRLLYGDRGTGRDAEYGVRTETQPDGTIKIFYWGISPHNTPEVESPITVDSILNDGYKYVTDHLLAGMIPPRDFEMRWSEEKLEILRQRDAHLPKSKQKLTKKDREQLEKIAAKREENLVREKEGKKPLKDLKPVEKGDWACGYCSFRAACFNKDGTPRDI